ncbi:MAG TPA: hypothetical protein PLG23_05845 [Thermoflexales bacterium]|nr:hypothetical protein [Thermoflexales bacterium]HQX10524.1 hypothetical protein [Thermoflexales bacterium]HQZ52965.1 hypothetical protein [Thermoflexales bacterium]
MRTLPWASWAPSVRRRARVAAASGWRWSNSALTAWLWVLM